jgi:hypothetical protein
MHRALAAAALVCTPATLAAQQRLAPVVVEASPDDTVAKADSASAGRVPAADLAARPIQRPGEVLETVPGVVVTQHSGSGKANQMFVRGMNLDHGTDLRTRVGGIPANMPSHGHGQGYTDLNFVIPELVRELRYRKGPYDVRDGDFASAGAIDLDYVDRLDRGVARVEGGSFGYTRGLVADSFELQSGHLLFGAEVLHADGPWTNPDDADRRNGVLRWSTGDDDRGFRLTAFGYDATWNATDQIPRRAVASGALGRFDAVDATDGGAAQRYALALDWHARDAGGTTSVLAYGQATDLELWSNFTFFLDDPVRGDQFEQRDERVTLGTEVSRTFLGEGIGADMANTLGVDLRADLIRNALHRTTRRTRFATTRRDEIALGGLGAFGENRATWTDWFRTVIGLRGDLFLADVDSDRRANSGSADDFLLSPKGSLIFGPLAGCELFVNGGLGFHSNDARGAVLRDDPATPAPGDGTRVDPLVRTQGAEVGVRTTGAGGQSAVSLWVLDVDSELVFIGDAGNTEASRASRRFGLELTNDWEPWPWLTLDADLSLSRGRFRSDDGSGRHIPGAIESVVAAGVTGRFDPLTASVRLRRFGPRALIEDGSVESSSTTLLNARLAIRCSERASLALDLFNLLDRRDSDIDYFYASRLAGEAQGIDDVHFHPIEPFALRVSFELRF